MKISKIFAWPDIQMWRLTNKLTIIFRKYAYRIFIKTVEPQETDTILDVGVSPRCGRGTNPLEIWYSHKSKITALTIEDLCKFSEFRNIYPQVNLVKGDGKAMDFSDNHFDIVFCNAVVEHVGETKAQQQFINEVCRVGKKIFLRTPNRWFPIDFHTLIPFAHWLPINIRNWIYIKIGRSYFATVDRLNLLTAKRLLSLFPKNVEARLIKQRFFGLTSNLIVVADKTKGG